MSVKTKILLALAMLVLLNFLLVIVFGDKGLVDLYLLTESKKRIEAKNDRLERENLGLYREIDRLKHDPEFIENMVRKELGVIGENEVIFKLGSPEAGGR